MRKIEYPERKTLRLRNYDYSQDGFCFITICVKNRRCVLGHIRNSKAWLSGIGRIVRDCYRAIPDHFRGVRLDEFVIMPNHLHGILVVENKNVPVRIADAESMVGSAIVGSADLRIPQRRTKMYIPKIIHGFKSSVTRMVHRKLHDYRFAWQKSYYDHIIRSEKSLGRIREYIRKNPQNWVGDRNNLGQ